LKNKRKKRGISPLIAIVIIVSTTMYISIAVTLWMTGIIGSMGYGTRPIRLELRSPISYGRLFRIYIRSMGGENIYIDNIWVNNKFAKMKLAYDAGYDGEIWFSTSNYEAKIWHRG